MGTLTGKTAVVTGSTSGIGLAMRAPSPAPAPISSSTAWATPADIEKERAAHRDRLQGQGGAIRPPT